MNEFASYALVACQTISLDALVRGLSKRPEHVTSQNNRKRKGNLLFYLLNRISNHYFRFQTHFACVPHFAARQILHRVAAVRAYIF